MRVLQRQLDPFESGMKTANASRSMVTGKSESVKF